MAKKTYDYLFKLLLIGDSAVGKTSLLVRFTDESFNSTFISTIGIDFKIKTVELESKKIKLQIWDTAGQERFHTITTSYYRGAMGIMLVFDVTNAKSFENVGKWLRNIQEHANEEVERLLIGNKVDMEGTRVVSREQAEALAAHHSIRYIETSAKSGVGVEEAFLALSRAIYDRKKRADAGASDRGGSAAPGHRSPNGPAVELTQANQSGREKVKGRCC